MLHLLLSLSTVHKLFANFLSVSAFGAGFVGVFFFCSSSQLPSVAEIHADESGEPKQ